MTLLPAKARPGVKNWNLGEVLWALGLAHYAAAIHLDDVLQVLDRRVHGRCLPGAMKVFVVLARVTGHLAPLDVQQTSRPSAASRFRVCAHIAAVVEVLGPVAELVVLRAQEPTVHQETHSRHDCTETKS